MKPIIFLIASSVLCYSSDGIKVKIVSKQETEKYLAFSGKSARLMTKGKIKDNRGCSKFLIDGDETTILQKDRYLCKKSGDPGVVPCNIKDPNSTWTIIPDQNSKFVSFQLGNSGKCLNNNGSDSADTMGNYLNARDCDPNSDAQKFKVKRIVAKKAKAW